MRKIECTDEVTVWHIDLINQLDVLYRKLNLEDDSSKKENIQSNIQALLDILFFQVVVKKEIALKEELKINEVRRNTDEKLLAVRQRLSGYTGPMPKVSGKSEPLGHVQLVDMKNYEDSNSFGDLIKPYEDKKRELRIHCPKCGYGFTHEVNVSGQITGGIGGAAAGAILGGKVGLALGPIGAIAGTIPGAILGGIFGKDFGNDFDNPRCPNCSIKFKIPNSLK